jgi:hypothetical protein
MNSAPNTLESLPTRDENGDWLAVIEATHQVLTEIEIFITYNGQGGRFKALARRGATVARRLGAH